MSRYWFICAAALLPACGSDTAMDSDGMAGHVTEEQVVEGYAELVLVSTSDALAKAEHLQEAVAIFVAAPSPSTHERAKRAWLDARFAYGQTEAFRFYGGPIDDDDGPEARLNAWPLDEAYIDYVEGAPAVGLVNDETVEISKANLAGLNEGAMGDVTGIGAAFEEDKAISTGYHAIEFLLWGQDLSEDGPGSRPFTDYLVGAEATAPSGDRRGQYLQTITELLVEDLGGVVAQWQPGGSYRQSFLAQPADEALARMLSGAGILSKGELASERMDVALQTRDQEDEHSCFSDNTHNDFLANALGIQNVWVGGYEWYDGVGIDQLVRQADPALAARVDAALLASLEAIVAIPVPFDNAIDAGGAAGQQTVEAAVNALYDQADLLVEAGLAIGLENVSVDLPE